MAPSTTAPSAASQPRRRRLPFLRKPSTPRFRFHRPRLRMWTDEPKNFEYLDDYRERRRLTLETIDASGFGWWVVFVAGVGFLTDAYDIFALNMVLPMIGYVYYERGTIPWQHTLLLKCATLVGTMVGQVTFGILGDFWGRRKMYGVELLVIIFATLGVAQCSPGVGHSMSLIGWLFFWRLLMGVGIGADYPLSAAITAEFAPTKHRARMMALLFWMQPLGQLLSTLVAMAVIAIMRDQIPGSTLVSECSDLDGDCARVVDTIWRWIIGIGAAPAIIAVFFRLTIPESPRYTLDVLNNTRKAQETVVYFKVQPPTEIDLVATTNVVTENSNNDPPAEPNHLSLPPPTTTGISGSSGVLRQRPLGGGLHHTNASGLTYINSSIATAPSANTFRLPSPALSIHPPTRQPFESTLPEGDPSHLSLPPTSYSNQQPAHSPYPPSHSASDLTASHFREDHCLRKASRQDLYQYFITSGNYRDLLGTSLSWFLLDLSFYGLSVHSPRGLAASLFLPAGSELSHDPPAMDSLWDMSVHSLVIVSIGACLGGAVMIKLSHYCSRKKIQFYGFLILAALLLVMGCSLAELVGKKSMANLRGIMIMLCVLLHFFFNFGPNTTTFIIPTEAFPTRYRCTAHGLSAAMGKAGSIVSQVIFSCVRRGGRGVDDDPVLLGHCMKGFAGVMVLGAIVTWRWAPETCDSDGRSRTLEELAGGRLGREECQWRDKARKEAQAGANEQGSHWGSQMGSRNASHNINGQSRSGIRVAEQDLGSSMMGSTLGRRSDVHPEEGEDSGMGHHNHDFRNHSTEHHDSQIERIRSR
ncbi:MFS general substrate transporter [Ascobolus immersus RN42]|uniref:MFS general substrate transporter n=1 Tax=Ascobolus immersus RN42 TaxID=1160509 RepID=A0A3N4I8R3_ASCIM|nr:MFS general substrate transporter [Ascobolus immersus RN42]